VLAAVAGRLTEADAGTVLLDGVPLTELDRAELRREVGYAFERPVLLGETIGSAIAFGAFEPPAHELARAARAACVDDFVRLLPDGYATRRADAPMSGGEVQRLGLARAFAHAGRLLVLDDATSSLDTVTELRVGEALVRDVRARTRLIVAHRASTAARADLVAWLEDGRVRAVDKHASLWSDPAYRALFDSGRPHGGSSHGGSSDEDSAHENRPHENRPHENVPHDGPPREGGSREGGPHGPERERAPHAAQEGPGPHG
jgi:ATP-binding cassette, subfamily B, bacterial